MLAYCENPYRRHLRLPIYPGCRKRGSLSVVWGYISQLYGSNASMCLCWDLAQLRHLFDRNLGRMICWMVCIWMSILTLPLFECPSVWMWLQVANPSDILFTSVKSCPLRIGAAVCVYDATKDACGSAPLTAHMMLPTIDLYESYLFFDAVYASWFIRELESSIYFTEFM